MSKQLILKFDAADRSVRDGLVLFQDQLYRSGRDKMLKGNLTAARKDFLKVVQICDGMNPVLPFIREFAKKGNGTLSTQLAFTSWKRRVSEGQELPLKENIFSANFRRGIEEEFGILPTQHNSKTFEGVCLDVR